MSDSYGKKLKRLRELAGVSQAQVAHELGVDRAFVSMVEAGFRNFTTPNAERVEEYLRQQGARRTREMQSVFIPAAVSA